MFDGSDSYLFDAPGAQGSQVGAGNNQYNYFGTGPRPSVEWPLQVGRPPLRAVAFQSRPGLVSRITAGLTGSGGAVLGQVVAAGDGGVGKTQLAADVFRRARNDGVDLVVWVTASGRESIVSGYANAGSAVGVGWGMPGDVAASRFLEWLAMTERSWLVVLDDVADPADVRSLWPEGPHGRVLATTRRRDLAVGQAEQISVEVFTPDESISYLTDKLAGTPVNPTNPNALDGASGLAADLGCLPVALAQAAAVIIDDGITSTQYRQRFADRTSTLTRLFPGTAPADDYAYTVATTWSLAIERANTLPLAGLAWPALELAAVLDPNGVPDNLWNTDPAIAYASQALAAAEDAERSAPTADEMRQALRNLHRLHLVTHEPSGGPTAVRTHALVQRATIDSLIADARLEMTVRAAADALVAMWPDPENDFAVSQTLRANALRLAEPASTALWSHGAHPLLFAIGRSLRVTGLVFDAVAYWDHLADTAAMILGHDARATLLARRELAYCRGEAGDPAGAVDAFERLLLDYLRVVGANDPATLSARGDQARWLGEAGNSAGAVDALEQLLTDSVRLRGPDHSETLTIRSNLAGWRGRAGAPALTAAAYEDLLGDIRRVLGPDHPTTLSVRGNLARWRGQAGDHAGAIAAHEDLLKDIRRVLGPDHPYALTTRENLACFRGSAGDEDAAVTELEGVVADRLRLLGPDHPYTFTARGNLATWRGFAGDVAGAIAAYKDLVEDSFRALGPDHPSTLIARGNLASHIGAAGDPSGAVAAYADLLDDVVRVLGPDDPSTATVRGNLEFWTHRLGSGPNAGD